MYCAPVPTGPADERLEGGEHLLEHPAAPSEDEPDARMADADAGTRARGAAAFSQSTTRLRQEIVAGRAVLGEDLIARRGAVVADGGAAHEDAGLRLGAGDRLGEELRRADAARAKDLLALRRPALVEHARAGEVHDGVGAVDDLRPIPGLFGGPGRELDLAGAAAARRPRTEPAARLRAGLAAAQDDDVVTALAERHDERTPDEAGSATDDDSHGLSRMPDGDDPSHLLRVFADWPR